MENGIAILIYGLSGVGKSTSLRNLPREKTAILNTENKRLPFKGESEFALNGKITSTDELLAGLGIVEEREDIEYVVIDSLSMYADQILYSEAILNAPLTAKGDRNTMEGWGNYKQALQNVIVTAKRSSKIYIMIGLEDQIMGDGFKTQIVTSCQGSLHGKIERDFPIVLRATVKEDEDEIKYVFETHRMPGENTTVKTPLGMIEESTIDNDIYKFIEDYVKPYYA